MGRACGMHARYQHMRDFSWSARRKKKRLEDLIKTDVICRTWRYWEELWGFERRSLACSSKHSKDISDTLKDAEYIYRPSNCYAIFAGCAWNKRTSGAWCPSIRKVQFKKCWMDLIKFVTDVMPLGNPMTTRFSISYNRKYKYGGQSVLWDGIDTNAICSRVI
jgi:hypothetical protein